MTASDQTVKLIWEGLLDADGMRRYYGHLTGRLDRLGDALQIAVVVFSSGAVAALLLHFPEWVQGAAAALSGACGVTLGFRRYPAKAARSAEIYRKITRLAAEWEDLWEDVYDRDDAELRAAWRDLSKRQGAILERVPHDLPLSRSLARRSEREADRFWVKSYASA